MDYLTVQRSPLRSSSSTLAPGYPSRRPKLIGETTKIVLTGSSIALAVFLVSLGMLFQVFLFNVYNISGGSVLTTAPLGRTLTIAHTSSVVLSLSAPLAVGLGAYWLAGKWLIASSTQGQDRPTPYQCVLYDNADIY